MTVWRTAFSEMIFRKAVRFSFAGESAAQKSRTDVREWGLLCGAVLGIAEKLPA